MHQFNVELENVKGEDPAIPSPRSFQGVEICSVFES